MSSSAPLQLDALKGVDPKTAKTIIGIVSAVALLVLVVVIYGHGRTSLASEPPWVSWLPIMDAIFNGTSALFLVAAYVAVRNRKFATHAKLMLCVSLASSACFSRFVHRLSLAARRHALPRTQGAIRPIYFFILISHIGLSAVVLPLIFSSFYFSLSGRFPPHKKVSRYTLPIWLYVSVTGVVVFFMLRAYA